MNDLYSRIVRERAGKEKLLAKLPGFRGYAELSARRQADRMIREYVANQLKIQLNRLPQIEKTLLDGAGGLSYMSKTRSTKTKFQTFIDRIATDTPGYSGFYDAGKVTSEDLEVIYAFDAALVDYADKFKELLDALNEAAGKGEGVNEALSTLDALTIEANEAYHMRDSVLQGIE
ncbi:MAG TPA: hypothetical protein VHP83_27465 [Aggregatilineaceae bacterium]|nr:hypothetical protein [Aggregatilineaceae bacterium]